MHYFSTNRLQDFEFHDAELSLISWEYNRLVVSAKYLNVHKDAAPNNADADMEISEARITFSGFQIKEFEPSSTWKTDENGNSYTDDPLIIHTGAIARSMFENELKNSITVMGIVLIFAYIAITAVILENIEVLPGTIRSEGFVFAIFIVVEILNLILSFLFAFRVKNIRKATIDEFRKSQMK